ncbi:molybdenum cofactor guanylyltransferase [Thalassotalea mangrovi]|uniref:Molybdenum cofactor guanylyltransferase n=1 Tax=Thalassotalea mangrovi TaxID=2572245 RepID=A0A4U1BAF2_9GAMM|nr:NTP transferase domain-containing protein [Thalassotalea mangrovi]TKB47395.1 molybdenum cofactor guanylyltransferase [Thalassotalea mangrovi]
MNTRFSSSILGVVLAGGRSQRMGRDKALLPALQQTKPSLAGDSQADISMLQFCQSLLTQVGIVDVVISGKQGQHGIVDDITHAGPLMGLYSVIQSTRPKAILALPVDMPLLGSNELNQIKLSGELSGQVTCYKDHPLPLYLPVNAMVEGFLKSEFLRLRANPEGRGPSFKQMFQQTGVNLLDCRTPERLHNTNTPEQWQRARQRARQIEQQRGFHCYVN